MALHELRTKNVIVYKAFKVVMGMLQKLSRD